MGQFLEFARIIEEKIKTEMKRAHSSPTPSEHNRVHDDLPPGFSSLLANQSQSRPTHPTQSRAKKAYGVVAKPLPPHDLSPEQKLAAHIFQTYQTPLSPRFTRKELKTAWRKLAKKTHPDQGGSESSFRAALKAYHDLTAVVGI